MSQELERVRALVEKAGAANVFELRAIVLELARAMLAWMEKTERGSNGEG